MTTLPPSGVVPPPVEPASAGKGCLRTGLIGCGVAALIVVAAFVAFFVYVQKKPEGLTDFMMKQIEKNYAPGVTEQEKEDLRAAYADFRKTLEAKKKPPAEAMNRVRGILTGSGQVTSEQVRELTRLFREAAGKAPETAPGSVPPEVTEYPEPEAVATPSP